MISFDDSSPCFCLALLHCCYGKRLCKLCLILLAGTAARVPENAVLQKKNKKNTCPFMEQEFFLSKKGKKCKVAVLLLKLKWLQGSEEDQMHVMNTNLHQHI